MATGYTSSVLSELGGFYVKATAEMLAQVRAAAAAEKQAATPDSPLEWTKYPPPRDPFAAKDAKP